ncbi:hypothetical protein ACJDT4_09360 [Clostridium neuense]|uniref:Uncharacterized protein n=1 Tax=Clostridium neuense TaxID=1728934 RepID=A0ABW8TDN6_9CLOT
MGVYINLDIMPSKISKEDWEGVYKETLELIHAYAFACIKTDCVQDIERIFIDRAEEIVEDDVDREIRYWRVCGDLETKRTGETFLLYEDIEKYNKNAEKDINDILELYLNDDTNGVSRIFNSKTQGEEYHIYVLAIACLIESRLKGKAVVYGDVTKEQAEIAIEWANGILKTPIQLPVRTDYNELVSRLNGLVGENVLGSFMSLKIGENEERLNEFIAENFDKEEINKYYMSKLKKHYTSLGQLGAEKILINYLNMGYSLEEISDLFCYKEEGPKFNEIDFVKAIADTWLFIPLKHRECMNILKKSSDNPTKIYHQFGLMFLNMGFLGRLNNKYLPFEEGLAILNNKFPEVQDIRKLVEDKNIEIIGTLQKMETELSQISESAIELHENKIICDFDELMYYTAEHQLSQEIEELIKQVKEFALNIMKSNENIIEILRDIDKKDDYVKLLVRVTKKDNLLLSRQAWNWVEGINDIKVYKVLIGIALTVASENVRDLKKAVFENREFFTKYIASICK